MTITPEVLEKVARGLGHYSLSGRDPHGRHIAWQKTADQKQYSGKSYSDGDLLLAVLNRAAELGHKPELRYRKGARDWRCEIELSQPVTPVYSKVGTVETALEAALLAFAQLPECQP